MALRSSSKKQKSLALPESSVDDVRFERNLLSMGFFTSQNLRKKKPEKSRTITQWVERDNKKVKASAEFRCFSLGLPGPACRDKYLAFMVIVMEQKRRLGVVANPIRFSGYQLLSILGLTDSGGNYADVDEWTQRMAETTIISKDMIYSAATEEFIKDTVHVFSRVKRRGVNNRKGVCRADEYEVYLEEWLLDNINHSWMIPLDFTTYKKLNKAVARGIFVPLTLWFYACRNKPFEKDYEAFCALLGIRCYQHPSKIKDVLDPSFQELIAVGYLTHWELQPMETKDGYKVLLHAGPELIRVLKLNRSLTEGGGKPPVIEGTTGDHDRITQALIARGISEAKATNLCATIHRDLLEDRMDFAEFEISRDTTNRITNPAGLTISVLEGKTPIPPTYETRSQRMEREKRQRDAAEKQRLEKEHQMKDEVARIRYVDWRREQAAKAIEKRFTDEEIKGELDAVRRGLDADLRRQIDRCAPAMRRETLMQVLQKRVAAELNLCSFDEWYEVNSQGDLFS